MGLDNLIYIPAFLLVLYTIPACILDLRKREMPVGFWTLLVVVCAPVTVLLYLTGYYSYYMAALSMGFIGAYLILLVMGWYGGADFWYLTWITLFFVQNPISGHILMPISFGIFLVASVVVFGVLGRTPFINKVLINNDLPGFPMMLPISLALILTVAIA